MHSSSSKLSYTGGGRLRLVSFALLLLRR